MSSLQTVLCIVSRDMREMFEREGRSGVDSGLNGCAVNENGQREPASQRDSAPLRSESSMRTGDVNHDQH